ncbi:unnamed protein product [Discosporangium mesarthrocarpum]
MRARSLLLVAALTCPVDSFVNVHLTRLTTSKKQWERPAVVSTPEKKAVALPKKKLPPIPADELFGMGFTRWRMQQAARHPEVAELELLMASIAEAVKAVAGFVRVAGVPDYGEGLDPRGLSVATLGMGRRHNDHARRILEVALRVSGKLGVIACEMRPPALVDQGFGEYVATFAPMVGASGLDAGVPTGTIFGVFKDDGRDDCVVDPDSMSDPVKQEEECLLRTLQPGTHLICAGYGMYSSSCELILAVKGEGVHGFTLDSHVGEFVLTNPYMTIPKRGKLYSLDESRRATWRDPLRTHVDILRDGKGQSGTRYSYRYIGSTVGDFHRTMVYGGIWGRPDTDIGVDAFGGDRTGGLTILGEAAPLSFIAEEAGGLARDGRGRPVLELQPKSLSERTGLFVGGEDDIRELECVLVQG